MKKKPTNSNRRAKGVVMLSFPAPEKLKQEITKIAAAHGLTRSGWIRLRLWEHVKKSGSGKKRR